uniref:UDENN FLCN/SMCR8-type domain-containing protein n=1 Tax=Oryzias melastigma TaxID=30732 RepID=A0A3B3CP68_ORYME
MIGSPDLLAFTSADEFEEGGREQGLPEELSVPLSPPRDPWSTKAQFHRDFILVAEFSEQVGPKPVLTIPDDQRVIGSFDLNHFSVRIMSVDYQASGPGLTPPTSPGPRLNFSEDSKVILGDSAEDAFVYVHHVTLYDLETRGMVRPFCMAYICSDQMKLMENFCELSAGFSQASESLKTGNRQAFSSELQRKLQELEYRRRTLLQDGNGSTEGGRKSDDLEGVERSILNNRELLRQVMSYPNRKLGEPDFLPYDPADSLTDPTALLPVEPCPSSLLTSITSERSLKPLQELCNDYFLSLMKEQLVDTERRLRRDRSVLRTTSITQSLSRKLRLTNFLFEAWSPEDADEDEGKGADAATHRAAGGKSSPEDIYSEPNRKEVFFSCVEELPIKLEAGEAGRVTPDPSATEMTGSVSSGDSIEVLGTEKSYRTQPGVILKFCSTEVQLGRVDVCLRHAAVDTGVRRVQASAKRANSEDSIEVLSTTESIIPEDLTAITEEEAEALSLTNGFGNEDCSLMGFLKEQRENAASASEPDEPSSDAEESLGDGMCCDGKREDTNAARSDETAVESAPQWPEVRQRKRLVPDLHVIFAPPVAPVDLDRRCLPSPPLRLLSVDEASDCTSFTSSSDPPTPTQSHPGNLQTSKRRRRKAGLRALRFIKQHSFSQHAVFCLLSGRPLVVMGGDEGLVRKLVDALSLFVPSPGHDGGAVMPCLTTPLQLTDLLTWRLIGIHRSSSSSSSAVLQSLNQYRRYLALLDLDKRTLQCPSYAGSLLATLADPHTGISRGITYLQHLESCLSALANRALLHTFGMAPSHLNTAAGLGGTEEDGLQTGLRRSDGDLRVMNFLSELIKQQHVGRGPPVLMFTYSSVQIFRCIYKIYFYYFLP